MTSMANYYGAEAIQQGGSMYNPQYGAALPFQKGRLNRGGSRLNFGAICMSLFLPWLVFCCMFYVMSFSLHYKEKLLCYFFVFVGLLVILFLAKLAHDAVKKQGQSSDSSWAVFLAASCFLAWLLGVTCGDLNYYYHMEPFYETNNLNSYGLSSLSAPIDPSEIPGQQLMDAGQIKFVEGSRLDVFKTVAFHNSDAYCVAPIVKGFVKQDHYDFWAVGMNCCSAKPGDFSCGEIGNPAARSGLRVMREDQRDYFRLAVKQAEATYKIKAKHPMFFHWMEDPSIELAAYMDEGFKYFLLGVYGFFALNLFLVIVAVVLIHMKH